MILKPHLALNYVEEKLQFPLGAQPKIDGVRALNMDGALTGRSLKQHRNVYVTDFFSRPEYVGFDGELAAEIETHPKLCRLTSSAASREKGQPFMLWHVFDLLNEETIKQEYSQRYLALQCRVYLMQSSGLCGHLRVVPMEICHDLEDLLYWDTLWLEMGYEGTIIRGLNAKHKQGKSTIREGGLLRIKRFVEEEFVVTKINEGHSNLNVAQTNELGKTFRTSHQENKVPNGQVGSMEGYMLKDSELFKKGQVITVSSGDMTEEEAKYFFEHPDKLIGEISKFKFFPKGIKNQPRFPTWKSLRSKEDI